VAVRTRQWVHSSANGMAAALAASAAAMRWSSVVGVGAAGSGGSTASKARAGPRWVSAMAISPSGPRPARLFKELAVPDGYMLAKQRSKSFGSWRAGEWGASTFLPRRDDEFVYVEPPDEKVSLGNRQSSVFCGIRCEFMQHKCKARDGVPPNVHGGTGPTRFEVLRM
jgi:hypothetical protein